MNGIVLKGLDGANPLAFFCAIGVLRLVSSSIPGAKLRWVLDGRWKPELLGTGLDEAELLGLLESAAWVPTDSFAELGKNITVPPDVFRSFAARAANEANTLDRRAADFAAAFGSDGCVDEKLPRIEYTSMCFITGSGHQDFLETMKALTALAGTEFLRRALFGTWEATDKGLSMRWDPGDAREYALRWNNPGPEGAWTMWGANRLAVEALPLFPTSPTAKGLETVGFRYSNKQEMLTWPMWSGALGIDMVRSLLAHGALQEDATDRRVLGALGVPEVFRSLRVRIGAGANFKVSFRPSRSV